MTDALFDKGALNVLRDSSLQEITSGIHLTQKPNYIEDCAYSPKHTPWAKCMTCSSGRDGQ